MTSALETFEEGRGMYSFPEIAKYIRIPIKTFRSWFKSRGGRPPLLARSANEGPWLNFDDFIHAYEVKSLIEAGVDRRMIRKAIADKSLSPMIEKYIKRIEFDKEGVPQVFVVYSKKFEDGTVKRVIMRPDLMFGDPIVEDCGYRASTLRDAVKTEGSLDAVMRLYGVDERDIIVAIEAFEYAPELKDASIKGPASIETPSTTVEEWVPLVSLRGIAPDATGEINSVDFVRSIRNEWD